MPDYDRDQFAPPAPVARVTLRNPTTKTVWSEVPMLLDSGADVTLLPRETLERLQIDVVPDKQYELVGFDQSASTSSIVRVELVFSGRTFRGQFLLIDQSWGIIGRNVMNSLPLLFDGPRLTWLVHNSA